MYFWHRISLITAQMIYQTLCIPEIHVLPNTDMMYHHWSYIFKRLHFAVFCSFNVEQCTIARFQKPILWYYKQKLLFYTWQICIFLYIFVNVRHFIASFPVQVMPEAYSTDWNSTCVTRLLHEKIRCFLCMKCSVAFHLFDPIAVILQFNKLRHASIACQIQ